MRGLRYRRHATPGALSWAEGWGPQTLQLCPDGSGMWPPGWADFGLGRPRVASWAPTPRGSAKGCWILPLGAEQEAGRQENTLGRLPFFPLPGERSLHPGLCLGVPGRRPVLRWRTKPASHSPSSGHSGVGQTGGLSLCLCPRPSGPFQNQLWSPGCSGEHVGTPWPAPPSHAALCWGGRETGAGGWGSGSRVRKHLV